MRNKLKVPLTLFACFFLVFAIFDITGAEAPKIRAKIGVQIQSAENVRRAISHDRLKADDLLRIYVLPEKASYVYVVHTDLTTATLLRMSQQKLRASALVMPSAHDYYQVDGNSEKEIFTIIVSPDELTEMADLFKTGKTSNQRWAETEKVLLEKGKIDLSQDVEKPFAIAGNVRGMAGTGDADPFVTRLQIFSGTSVLIKRYAFSVKK